MAALTVQQSALTGVVTTTTAAGGSGDTFLNNGKTILEVTNGSGSPITVTITSTAAATPGLAQTPVSQTVAAGATKRFGPFPPNAFNDATAGTVAVAYSLNTSVTVAAISQ